MDRPSFEPEPATQAGEADDWLRCHVHDTALQALEYIAGDGFGAGLGHDEVRTLARDAADELRATLERTAPEDVPDLLRALERCVADVRLRTDATVVLDGEPDVGEPGPAGASALAGAVREALTNAAKHASAGRIAVHVERRPDAVQVTVADDGTGVAPGRQFAGLGIRRSIYGRLARRGGRALVESVPGFGTRVVLSVPDRAGRR